MCVPAPSQSNMQHIRLTDANGLPHNVDGLPAVRGYVHGELRYAVFYEHGLFGRAGGGATWLDFSNGAVVCARYMSPSGLLHNLHGPAEERFDEDGTLRARYFMVNGQLHRHCGPAYLFRAPHATYTQFFVKGKRHNETGPAYIKESPTDTQLVYYHHGHLDTRRTFTALKLVDGVATHRIVWNHGVFTNVP